MSDTVAAVVVTHNRRELLRECLRALGAQTRPVDRILVVDNASADGTADMVRAEFPAVDLLRREINDGGAGGFHAGMRAAAESGADWLWVLDDDTIARPDTLERLLGALERVPAGPRPAVLASRVEWRDGRPHPMNMPVVRRRDVAGLIGACEARLLPLRTASFVSVLVHREAVERHGLPIRGFFFQADDMEYTARVLRAERGFLVPDSVVEHRTRVAHDALSDPDDRRFYFHLRNTLFMVRGRSWSPEEKPGLVWVVLRSAAHYLRANRFSPGSARTVARALRDGLGALPDT